MFNTSSKLQFLHVVPLRNFSMQQQLSTNWDFLQSPQTELPKCGEQDFFSCDNEGLVMLLPLSIQTQMVRKTSQCYTEEKKTDQVKILPFSGFIYFLNINNAKKILHMHHETVQYVLLHNF